MKTIKLPYKTDEDFIPLLKQYSNIVRYSYNRFYENNSIIKIRSLVKNLSNINELGSFLRECAILDAKAIYTRFKEKKVVFGGKRNFIQRCKNKINEKEFKLNKLFPLNTQGSILRKGNRSFNLDIIDNNQLIFKLNRKKHIIFKLPNLQNNIKKDLFKLESLNNINNIEVGYKYCIKFDLNYVYISFEEFKEPKIQLNPNRYLGIDMNPDNIGISVLDNGKVIHTRQFSLKPIFDKILSQKLSIDSIKMKYYQHKLQYETLEISKTISNLAKQYKCQTVYIEDLNGLSKFKSISKHVNRKNKNLWKKDLFILNLTKRLNIFNIKLYKVNPAYSSFIGNMQYDYTDSVNASIEIARRGFEYHVKGNKKGFYPVMLVKHQWKEMATKFDNWKEFYLEVKNLKLKYRVSLDEVKYKFKVFKQNSSYKSKVMNLSFI